MNLDFAKVCGKHIGIYEAYYKQIDPKGTGGIEAMTAAKFLKKSGLSDVVLSRIWDLSDPNGKGFLDKPGFFVALKLVSLSQAGLVANMNNIYVETANAPKVGELPKVLPSRIQTVPVPSGGGVSTGDWTISVIDRLKYEQLFESLNPQAGMLPGNKVKGVLMDSKLPMNILGTIWDLADQDKDGNLDKHEFIVAMHLVYQTLQKRTVPSVLPPELRKPGSAGPPPVKPAMPPPPAAAAMPRAPSGEGFGDGGFVANFPKDIAPPAAIPPLPVAVPPMTRIPPVGAVSQPLIQTDPLIPIGAPPSVTANADWVVSAVEMKRFEDIFRQSDLDKDGLVSGLEVKDIFMKSGIPQRSLADIWALCDTNQSGKLTVEQFALAMWFVERKQRGIDPPHVLNANMVPPSMRSIVSGVDLQPQEAKPTYSNPELEMISKEIEELARERRALETEIAQKEADVRIKNGEVRSLQSELDTLTATLKQLENQRGEAQKRLDDLQAQVTKIRDQCQKQEETINEQEGELNAKRSELQKLKDEETSLQKEYDDNNRELNKLTKHLQNTQLQISSVRSMVTQLMETQRQMTDALLICRAAMENSNAELVSEYQLKIEPDFDDARKTLEKQIDIPKDDPFDENNSGAANKATANGFDSDPFGGAAKPTISTGFDDSFSMSSGFDSGFDAFGQSGTAAGGFGQTQRDPFGGDAFGGHKTNAITPEPGKDDFGSDPFAALHAPTGQGQVLSPNTQKSGPPPRPESPSPALPPKKSKVPPPRPAPPRASQPTSGFGGGVSGSGGFADFDDFDNKTGGVGVGVGAGGSSVFEAFGQPKTTTPSIITGPTDFKDDPFKDYRYEDPFDIKDPFADDTEEEEKEATAGGVGRKKNFAEDFSSEDEIALANNNHNMIPPKSGTPLSNDILQQFEAFNLNASPALSHHSSASNSNYKKSQTALDAFADFEDFATITTTTTTAASATIITTTTTKTSNTNKLNDSFFDAFNDNFNLNGNHSTTTTNNKMTLANNEQINNKKLQPAVAFDAFATASSGGVGGGATTIAAPVVAADGKLFNAFNDNFDEDDCFGVTKTQTTTKQLDNSFAKFDAHNFSNDFSNSFNEHGSTPKKKNNNNNNAIGENKIEPKATEKFSADYSKPESFDADLEEALKRSMIDN
ncbi:uncharacterized protein Dwil_GK21653, isoform C [Drosophila willistoni]|nr:uncharacterized protein Dwil_GK21653, isoform C [Drosophila willistoni]